ncbi:MAG: type II toxin-antitoxin system VapC family toxin [Deltaproteobacteria bacterium]|nr:type II toxin-antitoxin system VapC family toxin [Deltaproteobacteria bacterium]
MVLLDSNIFVIDRFFPRDAHFATNREFLDSLSTREAGISTFTLMELCGIASFNLTPKDLRLWLYSFPTVYPIRILDPWGIGAEASSPWLSQFLVDLTDKISRKMSFGDAVLLREAERYGVEAIITWNTKDFLRRTTIPVRTPATYLQHLS